MSELYFQGDVLLERVERVPDAKVGEKIAADPDGATVLARGEVTGHRHRFALEDRVAMFRDESQVGSAAELYIGHIEIGDAGATLLHEEHASIVLSPGCYRVRKQREWDAGAVRIVAD